MKRRTLNFNSEFDRKYLAFAVFLGGFSHALTITNAI